MIREDLLDLIEDCNDMLALSDTDLSGMGTDRESVEAALVGCLRDLARIDGGTNYDAS